MDIKIVKTQSPKAKPAWENAGFCKYYTDHMFVMDGNKATGWRDARIVPYGPFPMEPASIVFHYAQESFEGMKAFYGVDGKIRLFRPDANMERMNITHKRMAIMEIDGDFVLKALNELIKVDRDWVPPIDEMAMYIRPFCIGNSTYLGVKSSDDFIYCIILSPVGAYYPEGMAPTKIYIEDRYVRSVEGGTGAYKAGANYAGTLQPGEEVIAKGFSQICWLDAKERKYIEEVGTSNIVFVIDGKVVTPTLETGTILPGITRDTALQLAREWGYDVEERKVSVEEVFAASREGRLNEAFATGTAAVISPVGLIHYKGEEAVINDQKIGPLSQRIYDEVTDLQYGRKEDTHGWIRIVE